VHLLSVVPEDLFWRRRQLARTATARMRPAQATRPWLVGSAS